MSRWLAVVVLLGVVLAACSGGGGGGSSAADREAARAARRAARQAARCQRHGTCPSVPDTGVPSSPGSTAPSGPLKPVLQGLLDRDGEPPAGYVPTAVRGWVVKAYWKDLQP
ncbi:MAG: hypothetical protein JOZ68_14860, partial [Acidimicrobiia bacterium]|nr:hypothetical protein [Acidimicrobiia bacterium]